MYVVLFEIHFKELSDVTEEEKTKKTYKIQTLYAHHLFSNKKFHEAMEQFLMLGTDPYEVICLFPDLVSQPNANESGSETPASNLPKLQDRDLENGLLALITYLTDVRHNLISDPKIKDKDKFDKSKDKNARGYKMKNISNVATEQLLKIIDTTLLKCYLQVS